MLTISTIRTWDFIAWLIATLIGIALHSAGGTSIAWSQDAAIPSVKPDRLREIATDRELEATILWAGTVQIRVQTPGGQQMLGRDKFEIVAWDGYTNAAEILAGCERGVQRLMSEFEAIELGGAEEQDLDRLQRGQNAVAAALNRIRPEAGPHLQRAQAILVVLKRNSPDLAVERHAVLQQAWSKLDGLATALQDEQFQKLPAICQQIQRDLATLVASYRTQEQQDVAREVAGRLNAILSNLPTAALQLTPLPDEMPPPEVFVVPQSLAAVRAQSRALQSVTETRWLGKPVHNWFTARQAELARHSARLESLQRTIGGLPDAMSELAALQAALANPDDADLTVVERQFKVLEAKLAGEESRLAGQQVDENIRYATDQVARLRNTLHMTQRKAILQILERKTTNCLDAAVSAISPQAARQSSAELSVWIQRWDDLPIAEYEGSVQLHISRTIAQLRFARMECAVRVAQAGVDQLRRHLDQTFGEVRAANIVRYRDQLQTWNISLKAIQQELQEAIKAGDGTLPPQSHRSVLQQAAAAHRDLDCAAALIEIHQDLSRLLPTIASLDEWNRYKASLDALEERANAQQTDCQPLLHLFAETFTAIGAERDMLARERPRIEFQDARDELQRQLTAFDAALQAKSLSLAQRQHQTVVGSLRRLNAMLQQVPALAETSSFKAQARDAGERTRELALQLGNLVDERRRETRWQPLPISGQPLAAPTPEDSALRIEMLLAQGQLPEADTELTQLRTSHLEPPWHARVNVLKTRLDYQRAMAQEEAGDLSSAQQAYETLADSAVEPTIAAAAQSAQRRITVRQQRERRERQARLRAILLGAALLPMLAGCLLLAWRSSPEQRLRRARKRWESAQQAAAQGDWEQRDRFLRAVAETLAKFPDNHREASRLREQMGQPDAVCDPCAAPRHVLSAELTGDGALDAALASADLLGVPVCLDWLRQHASVERGQPRYDQIVQWLADRLVPHPEMLSERLDQVAVYATELHTLVPDQTWPSLYAVCARWWLGDRAEAQVLARCLPETPEAVPGAGRLRMVLALCWWKTGKTSQAASLLRILQQDPQDREVRAEAKRWLGIIRAARPPTAKKNADPSIAEVAASLLRH